MHAADAALEVRAHSAAPARTSVSASFVDSPWEPEGVAQPLPVDFGRGSDEQYDGLPRSMRSRSTGPTTRRGAGDTPSRRTIFTCRPGARRRRVAPARRQILYAARAPRVSPAADERGDRHAARLLRRGTRRRAASRRGIQSAHRAHAGQLQLPVPHRAASRPARRPAAVYRLSDLDLASRLSFFLWNSIPDDTLLDAGRTRDDCTTRRCSPQQVTRMLRDPRATLAGRRTSPASGSACARRRRSLPDPNVFPEFDENLRRAFMQGNHDVRREPGRATIAASSS